MSWFKRVGRIIHPISAAIIPKGGGDTRSNQAMAQWQTGQDTKNALDKEMTDYNNIPTRLRDAYTQSAHSAGTFGATPQFEAGLNSEVQAGARGARTEAAARINALRKSLGDTEEFKPEGLGGTQGNVTQETLRNTPEAPASSVTTPTPNPGDNATTQNPAPSTPDSATAATSVKASAIKRGMANGPGRLGALKNLKV